MDYSLPAFKNLVIRREEPGDEDAIRRVLQAAFKTGVEAAMVEKLRLRGGFTLSLVAVVDGEVVGHILFSPVTIHAAQREYTAQGMGPLAVLPERQQQGLGSMLVEAGHDWLRKAGEKAVILLGHPWYYPRFGYLPASRWGIHFGDDVPDEAFMALELVPGGLDGVSGEVEYPPEFEGV